MIYVISFCVTTHVPYLHFQDHAVTKRTRIVLEQICEVNDATRTRGQGWREQNPTPQKVWYSGRNVQSRKATENMKHMKHHEKS
jgi:hypothetical protein